MELTAVGLRASGFGWLELTDPEMRLDGQNEGRTQISLGARLTWTGTRWARGSPRRAADAVKSAPGKRGEGLFLPPFPRYELRCPRLDV